MLSCFLGGSPSPPVSCFSTCKRNPMPKMPWGWGKSTSKESRKASKDIVGCAQQPRVQSVPGRRVGNKIEEETAVPRQPRFSLDVTQQNSDPRSVFNIGQIISRSPSPSTPSTRCPSFSDKKPPAQPLPLPAAPLGRTYSGNGLPAPHLGSTRLSQSPSLPLPSSEPSEHRILTFDSNEGEQVTSGCASGSNSSVSSLGSVDVVEPWTPGASPLSRSRGVHDTDAADQTRHQSPSLGSVTPKHSRNPSKQDLSRPSSPLPNGRAPSTSPKRGYLDSKRIPSPIRLDHTQRFLQQNGSAPDSTLSSPRRVSSSELAAHGGLRNRPDMLSGSAQGSNPGSGHNSGHNSSAGETAQIFWNNQNNQNRKSPEPSPSPSPRHRSAGPSGTVSPLHPRVLGVGPGAPESPTSWHDDLKTSAHPLPLPPRSHVGSPHPSPPISSSSSPAPTPGRQNSRGDISSGILPTRWQKGKLLGSGTFGNVYVGFNSDSGSLCAIKEVLLVSDDSKSKESVKQLGQEISLLSRLRHQNIVQYIGTETLEDRLCIYLEYVSGGSIHKLLQEYGSFKEPVIRSFTRQILSGLAYLHNMNTVHRDVKGANILVDTNGKVKLADFGMAKHITAQSFPLSFKGSPYWMAPEVIKHTNGYDLAVDIWSLGCTVLEMATAKPPWSQYEGVAAMFKIGNSKELPVIPDTLSPQGKDFVLLCLQRDPNQRPTAEQLLKHPFVENQDDKVDCSDTTVGFQQLAMGNNRHENDGGFPLVLRSRHLSPTSSDLSRNIQIGYVAQSNSNSLSPTSQSRRHVFNGLSSPHASGSSTPHNGGYASPHGSAHGSAHGSSHGTSHAHAFSNGNYATMHNQYADGYINTSRPNGMYGGVQTMNGMYPEPARSEFHWGPTTTHRTPEGSPRRRDLAPDSDILGMFRVPPAGEEDPRGRLYGNNLAEHVRQQLVRSSAKHYHTLANNRPTSPGGNDLGHL